jgi:hypothetical protein
VIFFGQLSSHAAVSFNDVTSQVQAKLTTAQVPAAMQPVIVAGAKACFVDRSAQKDASLTPESCQQLQNQAATQDPQMAAMTKAVGQIVTDAAITANEDNFDNAFNWGIGYGVILCMITLLLSFFLPRHIRPENPDALV